MGNPALLPSIKTVAALLLLNPALYRAPAIYLEGYSTPGDGGQGVLYAAPASTATPDNGVVFQPTGVATGRWVREVPGPFGLLIWWGVDVTGATLNSTQLQACHDWCYTNECGMWFPAGNVCGSLKIWKGVSIDMPPGSLWIGEPGYDNILAPDFSVSATGSLANFPQNGHLNINGRVNDSGTPVPVGPATNYNRPYYPVVGAWSSGGTFNLGDFVTVSGGAIWQAVRLVFAGVNTAGASSPSGTAGMHSDGAIVWQYIAAAQAYAGPAIVAFPASTGPSVRTDAWGFVNGWDFRINGISLSESIATATAAHVGGVYSQRPFYRCTFNGYVESSGYGYLNVPANTNFANQVFAPDTTQFGNKGGFFLTCTENFITFNGTKVIVANMQIFVGTGAQGGKFLQGASDDSGGGSDLSGYYAETPTGQTAIWLSGSKVQAAGAIFGSGYAQITCSGSTFTNCAFLGAFAWLSGDQCIIEAAELPEVNGYSVTDYGTGNSFEAGYQESVAPLGRRVNIAGTKWSPVGRFTAEIQDWIGNPIQNGQGFRSLDGCAIPFTEIALTAGGSVTIDQTGATRIGGYVTVPAPGTFVMASASTQAMTAGIANNARWPHDCIGSFIFHIRYAGNTTPTINVFDLTTSTLFGTYSAAYNTGSGFFTAAVQAPAGLVSGHSYEFSFSNTAGVAMDIQYIMFLPWRQLSTTVAAYIRNLLLTTTAGITAHAGGGQTNATPLPDGNNDVNTVASANDSVVLPSAQAGLMIFVTNTAVTSMQVYGLTTDTISGAAAGTGVAQAGGTTYCYFAYASGLWRRSPWT